MWGSIGLVLFSASNLPEVMCVCVCVRVCVCRIPRLRLTIVKSNCVAANTRFKPTTALISSLYGLWLCVCKCSGWELVRSGQGGSRGPSFVLEVWVWVDGYYGILWRRALYPTMWFGWSGVAENGRAARSPYANFQRGSVAPGFGVM